MRFRRRIRSSTRRSFSLQERQEYNYAGVFPVRRHEPPDAHPCASRWTSSGISAGRIFKLVGADPEIAECGSTATILALRRSATNTVTWCNGYHGPTIGIAWTDDFETFHQLEKHFFPITATGFCSRARSGAGSRCCRVKRHGSHAFGGHFLLRSPDMEFWGRHRHVMSPQRSVSAWQCMKIGAGPFPSRPRKVASVLPRGASLMQRLCLRLRLGIAGLEEPWKVPQRLPPDLPSRNGTNAWATFRT